MITYTEAFLCKLHRAKEPIHIPTLKFGGSPVLFHSIEWPKCSFCGQELEFLVQVPLQEPIRLSNQFYMAYVFMCPGKFDERGWLTCHTWEPNSGANLVLLQRKEITTTIYEHPSEYPDYEAKLTLTQEAVIDNSSDVNLDEEILETVHETTKLGGTPLWLQFNEKPNCPNCGGKMKFIAQLDAVLDGRLPADSKEWDTGKFKFFHFGGDDGLAYLFLCENECDPTGVSFLWQCT